MSKIIIGAALIATSILDPELAPFLVPIALGLILSGRIGQHSPGVGIAIRQTAAPWNVVYGRTRLGGVIIYAENGGWKNSTARQILAHAGHQVWAYLGYYVDGRLVILNSSGDSAGGNLYDWTGTQYNYDVPSGGGLPYVHWETRYGLGDQPGFADLYSYSTNWTAACNVAGRACSYLRFRYDPDDPTKMQGMWPNGLPGVRIDIAGKCDIYDPRTATRGYTENWALCVADYLCNQDFGLGCNYATEIDEEQLIAAANICDEAIALARSGANLPPWQKDTPYVIGASVLPTVPNGYYYTCVAAGHSGDTEPPWPTQTGQNITDGSGNNQMTWTCSGPVPSGYEPRYAMNGTFQVQGTPGEVLQNMMTAAAGRVSYVGGIWKIFPAVWNGVGISLGDNDLTAGPKWYATRKFRDLVNAVKGTFICPTYPYIDSGPGLPLGQQQQSNDYFDGKWQPTDFPVVQSAKYLCDDAGTADTTDHGIWIAGTTYALNDAVMCQGEPYVCILANVATNATAPGLGASWQTYWTHVVQQRLWQDLKLPFTISAAAAQRIAKIYLMRNRRQGTGTVACKLGALRAQALDILQVTHANFTWTSKLLEVSALRTNFAEGDVTKNEAPSIGVELDVQETDPSIYEWSAAEEQILYAPGASIPIGAE